MSDPVARWGPGGAAAALTASGTDDLPPAWAGGARAAGLRGACCGALATRAHRAAATCPKLGRHARAASTAPSGPPTRRGSPSRTKGCCAATARFEALRLYGGRPFALDEHLARLQRSCAGLRLERDLDALRAEIAALLEAAGPVDGVLRIVLTRGGRRIVLVEPLPHHPPIARVATVRYAPNRVIDGLKTLSYAGNMLARRLAQEAGLRRRAAGHPARPRARGRDVELLLGPRRRAAARRRWRTGSSPRSPARS